MSEQKNKQGKKEKKRKKKERKEKKKKVRRDVGVKIESYVLNLTYLLFIFRTCLFFSPTQVCESEISFGLFFLSPVFFYCNYFFFLFDILATTFLIICVVTIHVTCPPLTRIVFSPLQRQIEPSPCADAFVFFAGERFNAPDAPPCERRSPEEIRILWAVYLFLKLNDAAQICLLWLIGNRTRSSQSQFSPIFFPRRLSVSTRKFYFNFFVFPIMFCFRCITSIFPPTGWSQVVTLFFSITRPWGR